MTPPGISDIQRNAAKPLYHQLIERLKTMIAGMTERGETLLPSERDLCRLFAVSHTTVRLALKELEVSGLLLRVPGKGTFLTENSSTAPKKQLVYGVILEELAGGRMTDFRLRLLNGTDREARKSGVSLMLLSQEDEIYMSLARNGQLAGLIVANPMLPDQRLRELKQLEIPLVTIGRSTMRGIAWVDNDNVAVGEAMTEHLLARGCRRIGFIGLQRDFTVTGDRLAGYKRALKRRGLTSHRNLIFFQQPGVQAGYPEAVELLKADVDGIVCMDDLIAMGALHSLHEAGRKCPEDVTVIGCNNSSFVEYSYPPLTSLDIEPENIGAEAVHVLQQIREGSDYSRETLLPFQLKMLRSTERD